MISDHLPVPLPRFLADTWNDDVGKGVHNMSQEIGTTQGRPC